MGDLSGLGTTSSGIWTRAEALEVATTGEVDVLVRNRQWQVVWPGTYADGGYVLDPVQRAVAAVLGSGGSQHHDGATTSGRAVHLRAAACGRTAARVHGLPLIDDDDPTTGACDGLRDDVAVASRARALDWDGRRLERRQLHLGVEDVVSLSSGLCLTPVPRTLFDCARLLTHEALVCAVDHALHVGLVTVAELARTAARLARKPGAPAFRRALDLADGRAESPNETLARLLLLPALPGLVPQVRLRERGRVLARFDLGDEAVRLAVEADGRAGHAGQRMVAKDQRRDRSSESRGWRTERLTWCDVRRGQEAALRRVVDADAAQRRRWTGTSRSSAV